MTETPCTRGGCTASASGKYCSRRCSAIARLCAGWTPHAALLRPDVRAASCRRGQQARAQQQRRARAKQIKDRLRPLLETPAFQGVEPELMAAIWAFGSMALRLGLKDGYQRGWHAKNTPTLKRRRTAA